MTTLHPKPIQISNQTQLQPHLLNLCQGNNYELRSMTCPNCRLLAVDPMDCGRCSEPICEPCRTDPFQKICRNCQTNLSAVVATSKRRQRTLDQAQFACPLGCERIDLQYKDIMWHVQTQCQNRNVRCPNECGLLIPISQLQIHTQELCKNDRVTCDKCHTVTLNRADLHRHQQVECQQAKHKYRLNCEHCQGESSQKHNCVRYLCDLLREIVGAEVYRAAEMRLRKTQSQQAVEKDFQGTLERLINDRFQIFKRQQESLTDNFKTFQEGFLGFKIEFEQYARYFKQKMTQAKQTEQMLNEKMESLQTQITEIGKHPKLSLEEIEDKILSRDDQLQDQFISKYTQLNKDKSKVQSQHAETISEVQKKINPRFNRGAVTLPPPHESVKRNQSVVDNLKNFFA